MAKPPISASVTIKQDIAKLPLTVLCNRITEALTADYNATASSTAAQYINREIEESEELIDDLEMGHWDSCLVDSIMTESGIPSQDSSRLTELLITAVNGDWKNTKVTKVGAILFDPIPTLDDLQQTKEWLCKQWDHTFESYHQHLDLMRLFAIGQKQNIHNLPGVLHDVYSEWRINYLIDRKKKGKKQTQCRITDFVSKSKAFKHIDSKNKQLIASAVATYGKCFSPLPIINAMYEIDDSLYEFVLYSYIMSETINNLISSNDGILPLQIDFWIIPRKITTNIRSNEVDDSDDEDEKDMSVVDDTSIFNIEKRLEIDETLKYKTFEIDLSSEKAKLQRTLQNMIEEIIPSKWPSHNRLICICDRRMAYHDFKVLGKDERDKYSKYDDEIPQLIQCDKTRKYDKKKDAIFIFKPPQKYGVFADDYSQEHLQYLSREYMLPKVIIKDAQYGYKEISGTYHSFDSQMFTLSFCCHSLNDIRVQWYINGWNMRIANISNFIKVWPQFFAKTKQNIQAIDRIEKNIICNWKLYIRNKEYEMYEQDLLRFQH